MSFEFKHCLQVIFFLRIEGSSLCRALEERGWWWILWRVTCKQGQIMREISGERCCRRLVTFLQFCRCWPDGRLPWSWVLRQWWVFLPQHFFLREGGYGRGGIDRRSPFFVWDNFIVPNAWHWLHLLLGGRNRGDWEEVRQNKVRIENGQEREEELNNWKDKLDI